MALYPQPIENLAIFNSEAFSNSTNTSLTETTADLLYLKYPSGQGTETLVSNNQDGSVAITQSNDDNSTKLATTAYVYNEILYLLTQPKTLYFFASQTIPISSFYRTFDIVMVGGGGSINSPGYQNSDGGALILGGAGGGGGSIIYTGVNINTSTFNQIIITLGGNTSAYLALNGIGGSNNFGTANVGGNGATPPSYSAGASGGVGGGFTIGTNNTYVSVDGSAGGTGGTGTSSNGSNISIPASGNPTLSYGNYGKGATNVSVQGYNGAGYYNLQANNATGGYIKIIFYP